jgi:hypothetical protein
MIWAGRVLLAVCVAAVVAVVLTAVVYGGAIR